MTSRSGRTARQAKPVRHPWSSALVTGATSGIGADIARILGAAGIPTVIVGRRTDRLAALAEELPSLEPLTADLGDSNGLLAVRERLADRSRPIELLVNNAGFGFAGQVASLPVEKHMAMIDVNVSALVALTRVALDSMLEKRRGWILQVSSVASFQPGPSAATYSATKAFVTSFTEALHEELRGTGVHATALCPGFTRTEFHLTSGDTSSSRLPNAVWLSSEAVAASGIRAVARGRALDVPGAGYKGLAALSSTMPRNAIRRLVGFGVRSRSAPTNDNHSV